MYENLIVNEMLPTAASCTGGESFQGKNIRSLGDRHYTFHYEVADKNFTAAWTKVAATRLATSTAANATHPRVLTMWGTSDWLVDRASSAWIAEVINRTTPGNGRFVVLDSIDHPFFRAASQEESYRIFAPPAAGAAAPARVFNPILLETLRAWLNETAATPREAASRNN